MARNNRIVRNEEELNKLLDLQDSDSESPFDDSDLDPDYKIPEDYNETNLTRDVSLNDTGSVKSKLRSKHPNPEKWKRNLSMKERCKGETYNDRKGNLHENRKMGKKCESNFCLRAKNRGCHTIMEADRKKIFEYFWNLKTWESKKIFVQSMVNKRKKSTTKQIKSSDPETSRRSCSIEYFLKISDTETIQVCKETFCATIGMATRTIGDWLNPSAVNNLYAIPTGSYGKLSKLL